MTNDIFTECYKIYPHHKGRSKKILAKAIFNQICGKGINTTVDGVKLTVQAEPEDILQGCKATAMSVIRDDSDDAGQFVAGFQVWLRQGRMFDYEDDALEEACKRYDEIQARVARSKLKVVR